MRKIWRLLKFFGIAAGGLVTLSFVISLFQGGCDQLAKDMKGIPFAALTSAVHGNLKVGNVSNIVEVPEADWPPDTRKEIRSLCRGDAAITGGIASVNTIEIYNEKDSDGNKRVTFWIQGTGFLFKLTDYGSYCLRGACTQANGATARPSRKYYK
jgi:hypothetical protein